MKLKKTWQSVNKCHCLIYPNSGFKIAWDLVIIVLSVYNSILIPFEFAYSVESSIWFEIVDRIVDAAFIIDIIISFRSVYRDSRTDELVTDSK